MSEIYFIRHAQASFGAENYDRLSDLGIRQARILGDYFFQLGLRFHSVYTGSMERQIGTAHRILSRLSQDSTKPDLHSVPEFNEYDSESVLKIQAPEMIREDLSLSEATTRIYTDQRSFQRVFEQAILRWISGQYDTPGVETWRAFTRRVRAGVTKVMEENRRKKRIAVFTSGGPVSVVMQMALGLSDEETIRLSWQIRNTSVSAFKYNAEHFSLFSFNSAAHLELHNDPELLTYR